MKPFIAALTLVLGLQPAWADPPAQGAYRTDTPYEFSSFPLLDILSPLNFFTCALGSTLPGQMVNAPRYLALVDSANCMGPGVSQTVGNQPFPTLAFSVRSTRASAADAQISMGHGHIMDRPQGTAADVFFHLQTRRSATQAPPNGEFVLNLAAPATNGSPGMRVRIAASPSQLSMVDVLDGSEALNLVVQGDTDQGVGRVALFGSPAGQFSYNADAVCIDANAVALGIGATGRTAVTFQGAGAASSPACYSRRRSDATTSAVSYTLYDDPSGARFQPAGRSVVLRDRDSSQLGLAVAGEVTMVQGASDGQRVADAQDGTPYDIVRTGGVLLRMERVPVAWSSLDGIVYRMDSMLQLDPSMPVDPSLPPIANQYEVHWSDANTSMVVTASSLGDCQLARRLFMANSFSCPPVMSLSGASTSWSLDTLLPAQGSGELLLSTNHAGAERGVLVRRVGVSGTLADFQAYALRASVVIPGQWDQMSLDCLGLCPTASQLSAFSGASVPDPTSALAAGLPTTILVASPVFAPVSPTSTASSLPSSTPQAYAWDATRYSLVDTSSNTPLPSLSSIQAFAWPQPTLVPHGGDGLVTFHWAYPAAGGPGSNPGFLRKVSDPGFVELALSPQALFSVPQDSRYGRFAGLTLPLRVSEDVGLEGLPSSAATNRSTGGLGIGTLPAFVIADGDAASFVLVDGQRKWVRPMLSVVELLSIPSVSVDPGLLSALVQPLVPASLPNPDLEDPSVESPAGFYPGPLDPALFEIVPSVRNGVRWTR